ncbi:MAG: hypothetical protein SCH71_06275 [Desulfobulbaceae bacterium]|nr:hypothetical protein [Desulfobulbaceae bacterium]
MNRRLHFRSGPLFLILVSLIIFNPGTVLAESPWQWNMVLKQDKDGDSMIMPTSLYIDPDKSLYYVVDSGRNRLLSFDRKGELLSIFTAGRELDIPFDMARTDEEGLWVVEKGKNSLSYIDLKARKVISNTLHYNGELIYPDRLEAEAGQLFILNKATGNILQYDADLKPGTRFSCEDCPWGFVDFKIHENSLWALDQRLNILYRFTMDGRQQEKIELGDTISFPVSFAIGPAGYLYILDRHGRKVSVHDKTGDFKYSFLAKGIARGQVYYPSEIRFDPWGGLCIVDEGNARVEVFMR